MSGVAAGPLVEVDDPGDARLELYRELRDATLRRDVECRHGCFVAEGQLAVRQLLASPYPVRSLLVAEEKGGSVAPLISAVRARGAPVYLASRAVIAVIAGFDLHRGVVAIGDRVEPTDAGSLVSAGHDPAAGPLVVGEGLNDHENLGGLFRNAAAFAATGVLLDPTSADPLYRRSIRVSLGHVLRVPFARLGDWPASLASLPAAGWELLALTPAPGAVALSSIERRGPVALLVGAEGPGLSAAAIAAAGRAVRIPMHAGVDSLNVATAAAVALHHLTRPVPGPRR